MPNLAFYLLIAIGGIIVLVMIAAGLFGEKLKRFGFHISFVDGIKADIETHIPTSKTSKDEIEGFRKKLDEMGSKLLELENKNFLGYYHIIVKSSSKCLDVYGGSKDDGANVQQWALHGGDNQQWMLVRTDDSHHFIFAKHSGKCLDVYGGSKDDGANVQQWVFHGGDNQQWELRQTNDGNYHLIAKHSGKCLDVYGGSWDDGANVQQWILHGGDNQKWELRAVK